MTGSSEHAEGALSGRAEARRIEDRELDEALNVVALQAVEGPKAGSVLLTRANGGPGLRRQTQNSYDHGGLSGEVLAAMERPPLL